MSVRLVSFPTVKPLDVELVLQTAHRTRVLCTVEEGMTMGGFGSAVAEVLSEANVPGLTFRRLGLPNRYPSEIGSQSYLRERYGLLPAQIASRIMEWLG